MKIHGTKLTLTALLAFAVTSVLPMTPAMAQVAPAASAGPTAGQTPAPPPPPAPILFENIDIAPAVEYYKTRVKIVERDFSVFHWAPDAQSSFWDHERPDDDPALLKVAQRWASSFWIDYGHRNQAGAVYGTGLYVAVDPVATDSYGSGVSTAVLLQLKMPKGLRLLDFLISEDMRPGQAPLSIAAQFQCPMSYTSNYFRDGGSYLPASCQRFIRKIFNDLVPIDGFAYSYSATNFPAACGNGQNANGNWYSQRAFVITNPAWIKQEHIRFFTAKSRLHEDERRLIQTLFTVNYNQELEKLEGVITQQSFEILSAFLKAHPDYALGKSHSVCDEDTCQITATMCDDGGHCEDLPFEKRARPGGGPLTAAAAARYGKRFYWADLEGKPKVRKYGEWLQENYFGCNGKFPYEVTK
jgi:hypothetical protein